jgi:NADP-dependent aldehyde dehydrogenase
MQIKGRNIIGFKTYSEGLVGVVAQNPATGEKIGPLFYRATISELNLAVGKAVEAFTVYRKKSGEEKATFLDEIATQIETLGDTLIQRYVAETALPEGRAAGERGRTCGQLRLFAQLLRDGNWVNARIDEALPDRQPLPRADIRSMERPLGPVGVFGASNFPLAFSVAGGDTASALAAGCPVIFKAHPAHPGTSELVGMAIQKAAELTNMPDGVFSMLHDDGIEIGQALVKHLNIKAVGFTGSFRGGKSLFDAANQRSEPIPVYAEMGSTNPVFMLPKSLKEQADSLAQGYVNSLTMGVGQFCTNPGLLMIQKNDEFVQNVKSRVEAAVGGTMLTPNMKSAFDSGIEKLQKSTETVGLGTTTEAKNVATPTVLRIDYQKFATDDELAEEVFGPSSVIVEAQNREEILAAAKNLTGHLTATVYGSEEELLEYADLLEILEQKVGRLLINGFPTGVEVCHAMVHGGPFPATTDSRSTSVGTGAITRFTRPVCFQDMPNTLLLDELKYENPLGILRLLNGKFER